MKIEEPFFPEPISCGADKGTNEGGKEIQEPILRKIFAAAYGKIQEESEDIGELSKKEKNKEVDQLDVDEMEKTE